MTFEIIYQCTLVGIYVVTTGYCIGHAANGREYRNLNLTISCITATLAAIALMRAIVSVLP